MNSLYDRYSHTDNTWVLNSSRLQITAHFREISFLLLNSKPCIMNFTYNSESAVLKVLFLPLSACWKVTDNSENKFIIMILLHTRCLADADLETYRQKHVC